MSVRSVFRGRRGLVLLLVGVALLALTVPNAWAWYHLSQARGDLARFQPEAAQDHLSQVLRVWSSSTEAHLLASRAARQRGDFKEADRHLRICQERLGDKTTEEIALEWALLQAAAGNVLEVEEYLQRRAENVPAQAPLVWEALAEGYIRLYRIIDALATVDHWLSVDADNLRALELRGLAYKNGRSATKGAIDLRRVVELDPLRDETRWRLILCLLDMGTYDEALTHLEYLATRRPEDPELQVRIARCHNMLGRGDQARALLDAVLEKHPDHPLALRTRGQFALADRKPELAERWLRRGAKEWPSDYQTQWLFFQSLLQQNKAEEARAQLRIAEDVKGRNERLGELTSRKLSDQPLDPALHYEMGMLLLRTGYPQEGVAWLRSAVNLDADHRPAHTALAEYYQKQGDETRAAEHRRRAGSTP